MISVFGVGGCRCRCRKLDRVPRVPPLPFQAGTLFFTLYTLVWISVRWNA